MALSRSLALVAVFTLLTVASAASSSSSSSHDAHALQRAHAPSFDCTDANDGLTVCVASGVVLVNERARYELEVPAKRTVACELTPVGRGDADLEVAPPAGGSVRAKTSREVGWCGCFNSCSAWWRQEAGARARGGGEKAAPRRIASSCLSALKPSFLPTHPQAYGADVVSFTAAEAEAAPSGPWTVEVLGFGDVSEFGLRCELGAPAPSTATDDVAALRRVVAACCSSPGSCPSLTAALKDAAAGGAGPCGVPPNECDARGCLTALSLSGDGLACPFPEAVGELTSIETLDLTLNDLHGDFGKHVAPALAKLSKLKNLHLALNRLRGDLPCTLFENSPSLTVLAVSGNALTGSVPSCAVAAPMQELYASRNALTGAPPPLKAATSLTVLALSDQAGDGLTGPLPDLAPARALKDARFDRNSLTGALPTDVPPALAAFDASHNTLTGKIPSWSDAVNLEVLILDANELGGPLPPSVAALPSLRVLSASSAALSGPLPSEWGPSLVRVRLANNSLTGPLPGALGGLDGLSMLDLSDNQLAGALTSFAGAIDAHTAATGDGRGGAPTPLRYVNLGGNRLDGAVPAGLASVGALAPGAWGAAPDGVLIRKTLNISHNALDGPLPTWLVTALATSKAVAIGMEGNAFACPPRGRSVRVARALPRAVAASVECVRDDGTRAPLEDVLEVDDSHAGRDRDDGEDEKEEEGTAFVDDEEKEEETHDHHSDVDGGRSSHTKADKDDEDDYKDDDKEEDDDHATKTDVDATPASRPRSHAEPASGLARPDSADHAPGSRARVDDASEAVDRAAAAAAAAARVAGAPHSTSDGVDPPPSSQHGHSATAAIVVGIALATAAAAAAKSGRLPSILSAALARTRGYYASLGRTHPGASTAAMELVDVDDAAFQPDAALVPKLKPGEGRGVALTARAGGPSEEGEDTIGAYRPPAEGDDVV